MEDEIKQLILEGYAVTFSSSIAGYSVLICDKDDRVISGADDNDIKLALRTAFELTPPKEDEHD